MVFKQEKDFKGFKDFVLPDFKIERSVIARISQKSFWSVHYFRKFETEVVAPDDIKTTLKGQSEYFKQLSEKVILTL